MMSDPPALLTGPLSWLLLSGVVGLCGSNSLPGGPEDCELARAKCAYRNSCYVPLQSYMIGCADVLAGRTTRCPWACKRALISLTSTDVGKALSACDCGDNDFCRESKERIEVCRPEVSHATADDTVVSCSVAKWICAADTLCSTALEFYHRLCRPMFHGRKCTLRCNNSLAILDRQEKASKLRDCYCDGTEDFPCRDIKQNTQRLCYGREVDEDHLYFPVTDAPASGVGCGATPPRGLVCYLIWSALLVMLVFRTSRGCCVSDTVSREEQTIERNCEKCPRPSESMSPKDKNWPWWWTSEIAQ